MKQVLKLLVLFFFPHPFKNHLLQKSLIEIHTLIINPKLGRLFDPKKGVPEPQFICPNFFIFKYNILDIHIY